MANFNVEKIKKLVLDKPFGLFLIQSGAKYNEQTVTIFDNNDRPAGSKKVVYFKCPACESAMENAYITDNPAIWTCDNCNAGGDALDYYRYKHKVDLLAKGAYVKAVAYLADVLDIPHTLTPLKKADAKINEENRNKSVDSNGNRIYDIYSSENRVFVEDGVYMHQWGLNYPSAISQFELFPEKAATQRVDNRIVKTFTGHAVNVFAPDEKIPFRVRNIDFNDITSFRNALNSDKLPFWGDVKDLQILMSWFAYCDLENITAVDLTVGGETASLFVGVHKIDGKNYFIGENEAFDENGDDFDGARYFSDAAHFTQKTDWFKVDCADEKEIVSLLPNLINYNERKITVPTLGYMAACLMNAHFERLEIKLTQLFFQGQNQAGKSQTFENVVIPFFGMPKTDWTNGGDFTKMLGKKLSDCNIIPVILNEYKPIKWSEFVKKAVSEFLRGAYDRTSPPVNTGVAGHAYYRYISPVWLVGEFRLDEPAAKDRTTVLDFEQHKPEENPWPKSMSEAMAEIVKQKKVMPKFGKGLLLYAMKKTDEEIERLFESARATKLAAVGSRNADGFAAIIAGLTLIDNYLKDEFDLTLKTAAGISLKDAVSVIVKASEDLYAENSETAQDDLAATFELLELMAEKGVISPALLSYKFIHKGKPNERIALNTNNCLVALSKFVKENGIKRDIVDDEVTFRSRLRATKLEVKSDNVKVGEIEDPIEGIKEVKIKCPQILTSKLEEKYGLRVLCGKRSAFEEEMELLENTPPEW